MSMEDETVNATCGQCAFNIKAEKPGDLDFCAAHDLFDFTHDDREACSDFEKGG